MMAPSRSRSVSRGQNEDSVKRDRLSKSADRNKSATRSRSKSVPKSKSRSRSKPAVNKRRSRSRKRSTSRRRRSGSRRRSRSRSRGGRNSGQKFRSRSPRGRSPGADDGYRLHVADLDEECRKADLEEVFMKFGPLKEIWLASYAPYYAFVVYRDRMDAQDACEGADGVRIAGRRLRVSLAKPRHRGPRERFVPGDRDDNRSDRGYSRHSSRSLSPPLSKLSGG